MNEDITPQEIMERITPAMREAAWNYCRAKAAAARIRRQIDAEQLKIILANDFRYDELSDKLAGQRITTVKDAWRMSEAEFQKYETECRKMRERLGYKVPEEECPALIAENEVRQARRNLFNVCEPITLGLTYDQLTGKLDLLEQMTECLVKILIPN